MSKRIHVYEELCPKNHICPCVKICPVHAISQKGYNAPKIDHNKCIKCGKCSTFCPKHCLVLEEE